MEWWKLFLLMVIPYLLGVVLGYLYCKYYGKYKEGKEEKMRTYFVSYFYVENGIPMVGEYKFGANFRVKTYEDVKELKRMISNYYEGQEIIIINWKEIK